MSLAGECSPLPASGPQSQPLTLPQFYPAPWRRLPGWTQQYILLLNAVMLLQDPILRIGQTTSAPVECSAIELRGATTKLLQAYISLVSFPRCVVFKRAPR